MSLPADVWRANCPPYVMKEHRCAIQQDLAAQTENVLARIVEITTRQRELFETGGHISMELDRELEKTIGEKERLFGAIRQHRADHGC